MGWWVDRGRLRMIYSKDVESAIDGTVEAEEVAKRLRAEIEQLKKRLPDSQASPENPPKD